MPATMDRYSVDHVRSIKPVLVLGPLPPGRVIGKCGEHLHIVPMPLKKFAKRDVVRRNTGDFRRVINAPNDHSHTEPPNFSADLGGPWPRRARSKHTARVSGGNH